MSNVRTLNSNNNKPNQEDWKNTTGHKLQEENQTDEPDYGTSNGNNINTIQPKELKISEVCTLFGQFLQGLEDKDREECFKKLKEEKIAGINLVQACEDAKIMDEMIKTLDFAFGIKLRFVEMINQIKKRLKELKKENNESEHASQTSPTNGTNQPKKSEFNVSNSECVIGEMHNIGENFEINNACKYYENKST